MRNKIYHKVFSLILIAPFLYLSNVSRSAEYAEVQQRIDQNVRDGKAIVVHVVVALADNINQGIVPTSRSLGNGQNPRTNLYWGALYGVGSFFKRRAGWSKVNYNFRPKQYVLKQILLKKNIQRGKQAVTVYLHAQAWNGKYIREAIQEYYQLLAGRRKQSLKLNSTLTIASASKAHLQVYIGHNGLMDFTINSLPLLKNKTPIKSAVILACQSRSYFTPILKKLNIHSLLLTNGLMAPEAYTLEAVIMSWVQGKSAKSVHQAAAQAYHRYQKNSLSASQKLFYTQKPRQ